jgi:amidase
MTELWQRSATELAEAIRTREVSSREVVDAHLDRIEKVNGDVNAVVVVLGERARAEADEADHRLAAGETPGPLHGVPFTVKENVDVAGTATTNALVALEGAIASEDAPQVAALRAAGAIAIGRTNLPDFGLRWHTDNALRGPTVNPWNAGRTPGGSSGGEAAALATGMTPLGIGNDLGGSLRWPSQCNGTAALKPSGGRVAHATVIEPVDAPLIIQLMAVQGPMARRVADLRLAFEQMIRPNPRDPWHVPAPLQGPALAGPIRVAVVADPGDGGVDADVAAGVRRAADALSDAGYAVDEASPPINEVARSWVDLLLTEVRFQLPFLQPVASADANRFLDIILGNEQVRTAEQTFADHIAREALARAWSTFQGERPLILGPVFTQQPFAVGDDLNPARATRSSTPCGWWWP